MNKSIPNNSCILAVALSSKGFGFSVIEGQSTLIDWGFKKAKGDKNADSVEKAKKIISHYRPCAIILEDTSGKDSRRSLRIRRLGKRMVALASQEGIQAAVFSREQVRELFFAEELGTKDELASIIAQKFPDELANRLPPTRKPWMSEDERMGIFEAVALGMTFRQFSKYN